MPLSFSTSAAAPALAPARPRQHPVRVIQQIVAAQFGCTQAALCGNSRRREDVRPRHAAMLLAREFTRCSLHDVAGRFGRDHTTVVHAVRRAAQLERECEEFAGSLMAARAACVAAFPSAAASNELAGGADQ